MDLKSFKRDLASVEGGRWVDGDEVPALQDVRVKVRGFTHPKARAMFAKAERTAPKDERDRNGKLKPEAVNRITRQMVADWGLVEIEGLTSGGEPVSAADVAGMIHEPELEPLVEAILMAVLAVDATREADRDALSGN